jgi:glycosyltransferase involved in cell wall biosynthesis
LVSKVRHRPYWVLVYGIEAWVELPYTKRLALRRAARVIGISEFTCQQVTRRQRVNAEGMALLPCAVDEALTTVEPAGAGPHQLVGKECRMVLTVGRMASSEQYKGHDVILRALPSVLSRVPNLAYVVVGDGDDRPRLEAMADGLGVRHHVIFTGLVTDAELAALYRRSDIFALPARTQLGDREAKGEGFGIVFLEAMAFGKPVIGPNYGAPAELIRHGENGLLVDPEDPAAIAGALLRLLEAPGDAKRLGEFARRWVRENYSFARFRQRLWEILHSTSDGKCRVPDRQTALQASSANASGCPGGHP